MRQADREGRVDMSKREIKRGRGREGIERRECKREKKKIQRGG